jgi:hypothetical protein
VAHSFLNKSNIHSLYESSKTYTESLTEHFPELQRIARNRPHDSKDPDFPNVTDGTSASIVQKTPKRVVQQLPTGTIEAENEDNWMGIIADYVYREKILPYANEDFSLFEKSHLVIEGGLTFGSTATYAPFINHEGYFCPDLTLPYWGDIFIQRGKKSAKSSSYVFIRSWWQKEDIERLIDSEEKYAREAKEKGSEYDATWDIKALREVLDEATSTKDDQAQTPHEEERSVDSDGIELVTGFQNGIGAEFLTFDPNSKKVVRTKKNKDPRGKMPLQWFFGDIDGTNPLGRGVIELIGGLQNLIDSDMQMYQYNRALMLAPPVIKYGDLPNFQYKPNIVLETDDPNAKIVPLTIDTSAVQNYPQLYGLQKSQLLNLVNSPDTSISAEIGNPGFSKTPAGIRSQQAMVSVDDNAVRKQFEAWFEDWSETAINLYFAEKSGIEVIQLDKETADKLRELAQEGKFDESLLNEKDEIIFNFDDKEYTFKFRVDASTSKIEDNATQLQGLQLVQQFIDSSPVLQQLVPPEKLLAIYNGVVTNSGVEDPEDLKVDIDKFLEQQQIAQQQAKEQAMQQQQMQEQQMQQPQMTENDMQLIQQLQQLGLPEQVIQEAIMMLNQGATAEQVLQALTQGAQR